MGDWLFVITIGGIGLAIALELAWPLLRPFCAVLYEELMAQHSQAQAQRRTALLKTFLPFFQAYKTVLTTYPPALLTASAPEVAAQIEMFAEAIRDVKARRDPEPDDPFAPPCEEAMRSQTVSSRCGTFVTGVCRTANLEARAAGDACQGADCRTTACRATRYA